MYHRITCDLTNISINPTDNMNEYRPTFWQQLFALVRRNVIIKRRNKGRTLTELLFPIYMVVLLVILTKTAKPKTAKEVLTPYGNGSNWYSSDWATTIPIPPVWLVLKNSNLEGEIALKAKDYFNFLPKPIEIIWCNNITEMEQEYFLNETRYFGLVFNGTSNYALRFPSETIPNGNTKFGSLGDCRSEDTKYDPFRSVKSNVKCEELKYFHSGFTFLQTVIDSSIIAVTKNQSLKQSEVPRARLQLYPKEEFVDNSQLWLSLSPTYMSFGFMPMVSILTVLFVMEKEKKIKDSMFMMGLRSSAFWLSWILVQGLLVFVLTLIITLVSSFSGLLPNINPLITFLLTFLFGMTTVMIAFLLSPFFKKEKTAGSFASILTMFASLIHLFMVFLPEEIPSGVFYLCALLSPTAYALGVQSIISQGLEINSYVGLSNLFDDEHFSAGSAIVMLLIDNILYALLALYFDHVIPGEYGPRFPWYFCFQKSYWVGKSEYSCPVLEDEGNADVEEVSAELKSKGVIRISSIVKVFGSGKKKTTAVNGISLTIYENQITAILGHNGAGKSTLVNMLVGTIQPTSGTAEIYGYDISKPSDMPHLRNMFGVCLQQDILFDELSAEEHLQFFGRMKGIPEKLLKKEVNFLLNNVGLFDNRHSPSKKLSGGQKRKLCVTIALIGNPKVILLDEPSSGVDAYSRRQLWSLLQTYKKDRVLILTTHFMDEADILSDRKAIITKGKLRCVGSSLFLKSRFGIGYHLTVDTKPDADVNLVNSLVESQISNAQLERYTGSEVYYLLPRSATNNFPKLFKVLENNIKADDELNFVRSYGISMTSLEEVFLKLGDEAEQEENANGYNTFTNSMSDYSTLTYKPSFLQTFLAFLKVRFVIFMRNPGQIFPIVLAPIVIIIVSYFLMRNNKSGEVKPESLLLQPSLYNNFSNVLPYFSKVEQSDFENYIRSMGTEIKNNIGMTPNITNLYNTYMSANVRSFDKNKVVWSWLFNETHIHSLPILQNLLSNAYLKLIGENDLEIQISNHPFPQTKKMAFSYDGNMYTWIILLAVFLGSIPSTISVDVVEDREGKIKDMLRVCGLSFTGYWFTTLCSHLIIFASVTLVIFVAIVWIIKLEFLNHTDAVICTAIEFILFMPSSLIFCYILSHLFNKKETARAIVPMIAYFPSMIMIIIELVVANINSHTGGILNAVFCFLWPLYTAQGALFWISLTSMRKTIFDEMKFGEVSFYTWDSNIVVSFVANIFHLCFWSLILPVVDIWKAGGSIFDLLGLGGTIPDGSNIEPSVKEDDDVREERLNVAKCLRDGFMANVPVVLISHLRKIYDSRSWLEELRHTKDGSKVAVNSLSLRIGSGEIFGLLGPNGAGKTTAIKTLVADEKQTCGKIVINGQELSSSLSKVFQMMGYCPQHDALWKEVKLREHLQLYAAIRGVPSHRIKEISDKFMSDLKISEHADKKAQDLSGGTKRKLSYCMAMIGHPKLALLDEPSTGMDPQAKRFLWQTIQSVFDRNSDRAAILTTHSMEEADALCTRLGIMVKGVMRCLGSIQHLKSLYGAGYILEIKWNAQSEIINAEHVKRFVSEIFEEFIVKESFEDRLIFNIPQTSVKSLSTIFLALENFKKQSKDIEEYSFSQTTLEQVFIGFAKEQEVEEGQQHKELNTVLSI